MYLVLSQLSFHIYLPAFFNREADFSLPIKISLNLDIPHQSSTCPLPCEIPKVSPSYPAFITFLLGPPILFSNEN